MDAGRSASTFFERVYELVRQVPPGRVTSYGAIAHLLGQPRAARTVGWALHGLANGTDVPWHRVINASGRVSTRHAPAAAGRQQALLEAEGVVFDATARVDFDRFGWDGAACVDAKDLLGAA